MDEILLILSIHVSYMNSLRPMPNRRARAPPVSFELVDDGAAAVDDILVTGDLSGPPLPRVRSATMRRWWAAQTTHFPPGHRSTIRWASCTPVAASRSRSKARASPPSRMKSTWPRSPSFGVALNQTS